MKDTRLQPFDLDDFVRAGSYTRLSDARWPEVSELAGLVDEMHLAFSPVVFGQGEALFAGIDLPALGFSVTEHAATDTATHIVLTK